MQRTLPIPRRRATLCHDGATEGESADGQVRAPHLFEAVVEYDPVGANLSNRDGLPACPFRTDDW